MHDFVYRDKNLYCEQVRVEDLARHFKTPFYIYSSKTIIEHYLKLKAAFREIKPLICFSVKANSNLAILKLLVDKGAGLDIVSGGELYRALKAGCPSKKIVYASVGKREDEIRAAIEKEILFFNIESHSELETINRIAKDLKKRVSVALRVNPDIETKTHRYIRTARAEDKFGLDFDSAREILLKQDAFSNLKIKGLHIHLGSQITTGAPFVRAISKVLNFIQYMAGAGITLQYLDIGGGLGIVYDKETPQTAEEFARRVMPFLKRTKLKIILEPGRFIVGNAGILVTKIIYIKHTPYKNFIIVDAGMNDLIRPALYGAYHKILPLAKSKGQPSKISRPEAEKNQKYDVVGPVCESCDFFAKNRRLPELKEEDYLAIMGAGAYGFSMASNYNSRPRAAEVIVVKDKIHLIRKRETYQDLIRNEIIPKL